MKTKTVESKLSVLLWAALLLALFARLFVAWSPVERSFSLSVPDDAYYYFTIARNIANGEGVTFDGFAPTNGFHPLWMLLITPLWLIAGGNATLPVHLALTLGALLDIVTIIGVWRLTKNLSSDTLIVGLIVLTYAWNPYNLAASVNGLETSLSVSLFVWSLVVYWNLRSDENALWQEWLKLGILWALLLLARTDYLIIIAPCGVDLLWRQRHQVWHMWSAALGGLLWIPWLAWNLKTFGTFTQISGKAYPYYLHTIWQAEGHTFQEWLRQEIRMAYGIFANLARLSGFSKAIILLSLGSLYLIYRTYLAKKLYNPAVADERKLLSGLIFPTVGAISLLLVHGLVRWMYIPWYFVPSSILLALWFAIILQWVSEHKKVLSVVVGTSFLILQIVSAAYLWQQGGMWPEQSQVAKTSLPQYIQLCEQFQIIGISDSGYYGYYLPCKVVNLDGVVNNQVYTAIRQQKFRDYLDNAGIQYVSLNHIIRQVVVIREGEVPDEPPFAP